MGVRMDLNSANGQLEKERNICSNNIETLNTLKDALLDFIVSTDELKGQSYDSARKYISDTYLPLIKGFILINEKIISCQETFISRYNSEVDHCSLDSSELEERISRLNSRIDDLENSSLLDSTNPLYNPRKKQMAEDMIYGYKRAISIIDSKRQKLSDYDCASENIFSGLEDIIESVEEGLKYIEEHPSWSKFTNSFCPAKELPEWAVLLNKAFEDNCDESYLDELANCKTFDDFEKTITYLGFKFVIDRVGFIINDKTEKRISPYVTVYTENKVSRNPDKPINIKTIVDEQGAKISLNGNLAINEHTKLSASAIGEDFSISANNDDWNTTVNSSNVSISKEFEIDEDKYEYQFSFDAKKIETNVSLSITTEIDGNKITSKAGIKVKKDDCKHVPPPSNPVTAPVPVLSPVFEKDWESMPLFEKGMVLGYAFEAEALYILAKKFGLKIIG